MWFRFSVEKEVGWGIEHLGPHPSNGDGNQDISLAFERLLYRVQSARPPEGEPEFKVMDSLEALKSLDSDGYLPGFGTSNFAAMVEPDFGRYFLIAAFHPYVSTGGYSIELVEVIAEPGFAPKP